MNGINYQTLLGNTNFFNNQKTKVKNQSVNENTKFGGKVTGTDKRSADTDTVEIDGQSREIPKAGYDRPKRVSVSQQTNYKKVDENGIQEGVTLSKEAKSLLDELREKYSNMDIKVVNWSTDEEQDYYAARTDKEYSVLIAPEALEAMAADEEVRAQYKSVLDSAGDNSKQLKEELGEDAKQIDNFSVTIDKDGNVSYMVTLIKDFEERNNQINKKSTEKTIEEEQAEKLEKQREQKRIDTKKIQAGSMDELIAAIKKELYPENTEVSE